MKKTFSLLLILLLLILSGTPIYAFDNVSNNLENTENINEITVTSAVYNPEETSYKVVIYLRDVEKFISNAKITVDNNDYYTDTEGKAEMHLLSGEYTINIEADGYFPLSTKINVMSDMANMFELYKSERPPFVDIVGNINLILDTKSIPLSNPVVHMSLFDEANTDIVEAAFVDSEGANGTFKMFYNTVDGSKTNLVVSLSRGGFLEFASKSDELQQYIPLTENEIGEYELYFMVYGKKSNIVKFKIVADSDDSAIKRTIIVKDNYGNPISDVEVVNVFTLLGKTNSDGKLYIPMYNSRYKLTASKDGYYSDTVEGILNSETTEIIITLQKKSSSSGGGGGGSSNNNTETKIDISKIPEVKAISLDGIATIFTTEGKVKINGQSVLDLIKDKNDLVIKGDGITLEFGTEIFQSSDIKEKLETENSRLDIEASSLIEKEVEDILQKIKSEQKFKPVLESISQFNMSIVDKNDKKIDISKFDFPVTIAIDMSKVVIDKDSFKTLTAVRLVKVESNDYKLIPLGGKYNEFSKTFTFKTDSFSMYTIVEMPEIRKVLLRVGSKDVEVNGSNIEIDTAPMIRDGRTMVPVRFISETLGADVKWNQQTKTVTIESGEKSLSLIVDKEIPEFDATIIMENGRTFVPLRYVSETLGAYVMWNPETREIDIIK